MRVITVPLAQLPPAEERVHDGYRESHGKDGDIADLRSPDHDLVVRWARDPSNAVPNRRQTRNNHERQKGGA